MKTLIGSKVEVYLKSTEDDSTSICGILIEVTESELYVQCSSVSKPFIWVVPRDNVKYCTISILPENKPLVYQEPPPKQDVEVKNTQHAKENILKVFVDDEIVATLLVPPVFDISTFNDNVINIISEHPDVQAALTNKIQKSIDYCPGKVYIKTVVGNVEVVPAQALIAVPNTDSFSVAMGKDIYERVLSPSEMVLRFNSFLRKDKKDDQTKV